MTIDITNLEHREALRVASTCMLLDKARTRDEWIAHCSDEPLALAFEALSDPAQAAELIRALVGRAGVSCVAPANLHEAVPPHGAARASVSATVHGTIRVSMMWRRRASDEVMGDTIASVEDRRCDAIVRLLVLEPGAGAADVLAALRGES